MGSKESNQRIGNLLDVPIHRLMEQLSAATAARLDRVCVVLILFRGTKLILAVSASPLITAVPDQTNTDDTLWVDRYRPNCFADLLGNDRVAREIMTWVKQWDWCVFGRKKSKKRPRESDENFTTEDEYHRPPQKVRIVVPSH